MYFRLQGIFYFLQGFFMTGFMVYGGVSLANWGLPLVQQTATQATIAIPAYFKMFTALLSDRVPIWRWGRRKPYIFLGLILFVPAFAYMFSIQEFSSLWILSMATVMAAWVLVDGTLDALTVDITPVVHQGAMQGVANGSRMVGYAAGTVVVPILGPKIGWSTTVGIIALFAVLQGVVALLYKEIPVTRQDLRKQLPVGKVFKKSFGSAKPWMGILFSLFIAAIGGVSTVTGQYVLTNLGWSKTPQLLSQFGYSKLVFFIGAAMAAFLFGKLASRFGNSMKFYTASFMGSWVLVLPWFLVPASGSNALPIFFAQFSTGLAYGILNVLALGVIMQICDPGIEGFMFATLMSFSNLGEYALGANVITNFEGLAGGIIPALFTPVPLTVMGLVFLYFMFRAVAKEKEKVEMRNET